MTEKCETGPLMRQLIVHNNVKVYGNGDYTKGTILLFSKDGNLVARLYDIDEIQIGGPQHD